MFPEYLVCAGTELGKRDSQRAPPAPIDTQQEQCSVERALQGDTGHSIVDSTNVHGLDSGLQRVYLLGEKT